MSITNTYDTVSVEDLNVKCPNQIVFIKSVKTGKFLRGAKFWPWTKKWNHAWPATPTKFIQRLNSGNLSKFGINSLEDVIIITSPDDLLNNT